VNTRLVVSLFGFGVIETDQRFSGAFEKMVKEYQNTALEILSG
jgi:hypothetical protein